MNETKQFINHLRGYGDVHMDADVQNDLLTAADEIERLEGDRISLAGALRTIRDSTAEVDSLSWQTADEALGQLGPGDTDE